jgi:hypothetical protein
MRRRTLLVLAACAASAAMPGILTSLDRPAAAERSDEQLLVSNDASGQLRTFDVNGRLDLDNPFFQDLGTNGRRCVTCHQPETAWTIAPENVQARFAETRGDDPIFRNNDGANCEGALPRTRAEKRAAYSLLLTKGLIRIGIDVPPSAEFAIDSVVDPNGCAPAANDVSFYRRPLPSTNLQFLTAVMWDGRESSSTTTIRQDQSRTSPYRGGTASPAASAALTSRACRHCPRYSNPGQLQVTSASTAIISYSRPL